MGSETTNAPPTGPASTSLLEKNGVRILLFLLLLTTAAAVAVIAIWVNQQQVTQSSNGSSLNTSLQSNSSSMKTISSSLSSFTSSEVTDPNLITKTVANDYCEFSFQYDKNLILQENDPNFFVLLRQGQNPYASNISIDGRAGYIHTEYENHKTAIINSLENVSLEEIHDGLIISGKVPPGERGGAQVSHFLFPCGGSSVDIGYSPGEITKDVYMAIVESVR